MSEETKLILEMFKEGKITLEETEKLLEGSHTIQNEPTQVKSFNKKFLKVLVKEGDKTNVNISLPLSLAEVGLKLIPKDQLKIQGTEINMNEILKQIQEGINGEFVNVDTIGDNGKEVKVKVFVD